jgi:DNA-binding NtrC family response regulator
MYGDLTRGERPYAFDYETAEIDQGKYGVDPVLKKIRKLQSLGAVVLDIMFGEKGSAQPLGLDILAAIRQQYPLLPVIVLTSESGNLSLVERAMELGANEYLVKFSGISELETVLRVYTDPSAGEQDQALWGNAPRIRWVRALIARVAIGGSASVLITGASGTGKELAARAIHRQGPRRSGPFIVKNCAFEDGDLLNSELFGHDRGAFTGAVREHIGLIERADHGVMFLDEIGSITPVLQGRLLRVLESGEFTRVGGSKSKRSSFQLVCATNREPKQMIAQNQMREDFFFRISHVEIKMPSLRDRREDIPLLAQLFLSRFKAGSGASYPAQTFSADFLHRLQQYEWPGNVRELRNVVERAVILTRAPVVEIDSLPPEISHHAREQDVIEDRPSYELPEDPKLWSRHRLLTELRLAVEAKRRSKSVAQFMRCMYPLQRRSSTAALQDLLRRLGKGPWGDPALLQDEELAGLVRELQH